MNTALRIHNKGLISSTKSRKSIRSFKKLGINKAKYHAQKDRVHERYKKVGNRMRDRYRKARGRSKDGRRRRRR